MDLRDKLRYAKDLVGRYHAEEDFYAEDINWSVLAEILSEYSRIMDNKMFATPSFPYFCAADQSWYWKDDLDEVCGPYLTEEEAAIDIEYYLRYTLGEAIKGAN